MSDTLNRDMTDEALANAIEAEEIEQDGRVVKRDPEKLMRVRERLNAADRVREQGTVFERGSIMVSRRG